MQIVIVNKKYKEIKGIFMKRGLLILFCMGMMVTGCADQKAGIQEEPEVYSLDLDGNIQMEETGGKQAVTGSEAAQSGETAENQESEAVSASKDSTQDNTGAQSGESASEDQDHANTQDLYSGFLKNEVPAIVRNDYLQSDYRTNNLESGRAYTFAELGQYVDQSYFDPEYMEKTTYDQAQYTYVGCLDNDAINLLVKFIGLNIYSPGDDSFAVYVLSEENGQLYLTGEYECWARSYTEQYRNGLCRSGGSSGAGDHYDGLSVFLSDGKEVSIYEAEILSGWWTSYVDGTIYSEVFGENADVPLEVSVYTIDGDMYHTFDMSECTDDQKTLCETYINRCRDEAGVNWVTEEQLQEAVRKRCSSLGIDYNMLEQQEEVEWIKIIDETDN